MFLNKRSDLGSFDKKKSFFKLHFTLIKEKFNVLLKMMKTRWCKMDF